MLGLLPWVTRVHATLARCKKLEIFLSTLRDSPILPDVSQNIALTSVPHWNTWRWDTRWVYFDEYPAIFYTSINGKYTVSRQCIQYLNGLTNCDDIHDWKCDIKDIYGLTNSKSPLEECSSIDHMAEVYSKDYIYPLSEETLQKNINHTGIRVLNSLDCGGDHFVQYLWDNGRIYLVNHDGSHHFAAAQYIARKIDKKITLNGLLRIYSFNDECVHHICKSYKIFLFDKQNTINLHEYMSIYRIEYGRCALPNPFRSYYAIFLPVGNKISMLVAKMMHDSGFFFLNDYFYRKIGCLPCNIHIGT